ncbi:MCE family protein [Nocardioides marmoriginsengisoli]|uniref:MCE family protein n=1 Tax=Nocardioides marmoriginsengisoli TaxID=661483 RepID=A0A3N0CP50_9ACTN|nr:MCE family protein [Nocardioides marmoriginsengisoli]RNL64826.1 MCE family protein [Nocardioides marmoriginsengisoli]
MAKALVRRELKRQDYAKRGLVTVMAGAVLLGLLFLRSSGTFGGPEHVSAQLADAGGSLGKSADVKVRGVIVGKVSGISRGSNGGVRIKIDIPGDKLDMVPANVVARILPATVFGTSFVDLAIHGAPAKDGLRAGATIPADSTQGTLELQQALDDIDTLVKAVGPAELASAIGSAAQALDGRGDQLGKTIDLANSYLAKLNPKMPLVRENLGKLVENLQLAEEVAPDLLKATNDALTTARTIVDQKAALTAAISGGTALSDQANTFLRANSPSLIRFIQNSAVLLDVVYTNRQAGITGAVMTNRMLNAKLSTVITEHGFINTIASLSLNVPPYYKAADCPQFGPARGDNCPGLGRAGVSSMLDGRAATPDRSAR